MGIFKSRKNEIELILRKQEELEEVYKNLNTIGREIRNISERQHELDKEKQVQEMDVKSNEEKLRAAYALNLCTVSVSQIIDYNDINILEQEYDIILNNLNLEYMPKDEPLLNTLKILLDTITFFRIQEKDKYFIEKEYQEKVRNAIWSAVPNFGLIIAGGNPITMALSLATQVGCGYMNYRKTRFQSNLDKEKAQWEIQKSAIEQFNGIRRELFDTAWRLADKYTFPDKYRLTERTIKKYNDILMDPDDYRRYDRLDAIKDKFIAYPPFWYYFGNAANLISQGEDDEGIKLYYKERAKENFKLYLNGVEYPLLREDPLLASCCLEYIDLLDFNSDISLINELLDKAVNTSGEYNDVLQLCGIYYLKVNNTNKASEILKRLVNEDYNATMNAQLLSKIYVYNYISRESNNDRYEYDILKKRINPKLLFPMPDNTRVIPETLNQDFMIKQKEILLKKFKLAMGEFIEKNNIKFNKLFPVPDKKKVYKESYFNNNIKSHESRIEGVRNRLENNEEMSKNYIQELKSANISFEILELFNNIINAISTLNFVIADEQIELLIKMEITKLKEELNKILEVDIGVNINSILRVLENLKFEDFTSMYFEEIDEIIDAYVKRKNSMEELMATEQNLKEFCIQEGIAEPEELFRKSEVYREIIETKRKPFTPELLGKNAILKNNEYQIVSQMIRNINNFKDEVILNKEKISIFVKGDNKYDIYMSNKQSKINTNLKKSVIAVLEDRGFSRNDMLFTQSGIILLGFNLKSIVKYNDIKICDTISSTIRIGSEYKNKDLNIEKMQELVEILSCE